MKLKYWLLVFAWIFLWIYIKHVYGMEMSTTTVAMSGKRIVQENLCPSGWEKSYWSLVESSTKPIESTRIYGGMIEVCKDNGILRIKK